MIKAKRLRRTRPYSYPWEEWFAAGEVTLVGGRHFHCNPYSFHQQILNASRRFGYHVSIGIGVNRFRLTCVPKNGRSK